MHTQHRGYLRGEAVPIKISIKHIKSLRSLSGVIVTLTRISRVSLENGEPQTFRKDIAQTVSPLYTDPVTFQSSISTTIKVPPDTFPTTKGHNVVSFVYCIEAVVDLSGSWSLKQTNEIDNYSISKFGFVDTDKLRQRRGSVNLWSELVIGTDRSGPIPSLNVNSGVISNTSSNTNNNNHGNHFSISSSDSISFGTIERQRPESSSSPSIRSDNSLIPYYEATSSSSSNPPIIPLHSSSNDNNNNNNNESEKERLQRLEEALLPSEPPEPPESVSTIPHYHEAEASAPPLTYDQIDDLHTTTTTESSDHHDDKLDIERQRLQQLVSVPPDTVPHEDDYVPEYSRDHPEPLAPSLPDHMYNSENNSSSNNN
jgi:hypothetical protein